MPHAVWTFETVTHAADMLPQAWLLISACLTVFIVSKRLLDMPQVNSALGTAKGSVKAQTWAQAGEGVAKIVKHSLHAL